MDMDEPASIAPIPSTSEGNAANSNIKSQAAATNTNAAPKMDISGKWLIQLNGTANSSAEVILIQSKSFADDGKDRIQGYGNINENSLITPLTATGSLSNDTLDLELKLGASNGASKLNKKYVLKMTLAEKILLGRYEIYSTDVLSGNGNATATRSGS
jgi:hypothetical protein